MITKLLTIAAAVLVLLEPSTAQVCTDFGKDIEGAAVDKQGNFFAVNGEHCGRFCTPKPEDTTS
jgi:hypothetical protein